MKKLAATFLVTTLILTSIAGCKPQEVETNIEGEKEGVETVVSSAGDLKVYESDYTYMYKNIKKNQEMQLIGMGYFTEENIDEFWNTDNNGTTMSAQLKDYALSNSKESLTLLKIASDKGITADETQINESMAQIDAEVESLKTDTTSGEEEFKNLYGFTPEEIKTYERKFAPIAAYTNSVFESVVISDEAAKEYYDENINQYEQATVRHILIGTEEGATEEKIKEAETKANELLDRINAGEDIGTLAAEFSEDPGSANNNGEYTFPRGQMVPEFEDWAFTAEKDKTGIVQTSYGFHIMQFLNKESTAFDEVKESIKSQLVNEEGSKIITSDIENTNLTWEDNNEAIDNLIIE